jgi:hypothetical protein
MKNPRKKEKISREEATGDEKIGETSWPKEEDVKNKNIGAQPSQMKRNATQEEEA